MKLIIGLGNPGKEYKNTRHNLGFFIVDEILNELNLKIDNKKFNGEFTTFKHNGEKVLIGKPSTYMNNSGNFVQQVKNYFNVDPEDILIIHDDKDIEAGKYKISHQGSSAGQNGVKDIIEKLSTKEFNRLRAGVGFPLKNEDTANYVLSNFNKEQKVKIKLILKDYINIAFDFISLSITELENKYNGK